MSLKTKVIARWHTRGKKYWLELVEHADGDAYSYRHETGGGYMGRISLDEAFRRMESELKSYAFDGHTLKRA